MAHFKIMIKIWDRFSCKKLIFLYLPLEKSKQILFYPRQKLIKSILALQESKQIAPKITR